MHLDRARESLDLEENPIVLALAQVVISPVLEIERFIPELQEKLRRTGYPLFERVDVQSIQLGAHESPAVTTESKWVFLDKDRSRSVSVGQSFVVLEQNQYSSFDDFIGSFTDALTSFHACVDPGIVQRLGFRRINLVQGSSALGAPEFIHETMLGVNGDALATNGRHHYEFRGETQEGNLMVRVVRPAPQGVLPPELSGGVLNIRQPASAFDSATIDIDHFTACSDDFSPSTIAAGFWQLHDASDLAFRETVTTKALEHWGGAQ